MDQLLYNFPSQLLNEANACADNIMLKQSSRDLLKISLLKQRLCVTKPASVHLLCASDHEKQSLYQEEQHKLLIRPSYEAAVDSELTCRTEVERSQQRR